MVNKSGLIYYLPIMQSFHGIEHCFQGQRGLIEKCSLRWLAATAKAGMSDDVTEIHEL